MRLVWLFLFVLVSTLSVGADDKKSNELFHRSVLSAPLAIEKKLEETDLQEEILETKEEEEGGLYSWLGLSSLFGPQDSSKGRHMNKGQGGGTDIGTKGNEIGVMAAIFSAIAALLALSAPVILGLILGALLKSHHMGGKGHGYGTSPSLQIGYTGPSIHVPPPTYLPPPTYVAPPTYVSTKSYGSSHGKGHY